MNICLLRLVIPILFIFIYYSTGLYACCSSRYRLYERTLFALEVDLYIYDTLFQGPLERIKIHDYPRIIGDSRAKGPQDGYF